MMTDHPVGNEDLLDIATTSARPGASARPSRRRPAVKVVVFQCPCGTAARQRWPRFERPRRGHLGRGAGLIDEHQSAGIEIAFARPAGARRRQALLLARFFLKLIGDRMPVPTDRSRSFSSACSSASVMSGVSSTLARNAAAPSIRPDRRFSDRARCGPSGATHRIHAHAEPCRRTTT